VSAQVSNIHREGHNEQFLPRREGTAATTSKAAKAPIRELAQDQDDGDPQPQPRPFTRDHPGHPRTEDDGEVAQRTGGAASITRSAKDPRWWRACRVPSLPRSAEDMVVANGVGGGCRGEGAGDPVGADEASLSRPPPPPPAEGELGFRFPVEWIGVVVMHFAGP
jgi:hypothetical protein